MKNELITQIIEKIDNFVVNIYNKYCCKAYFDVSQSTDTFCKLISEYPDESEHMLGYINAIVSKDIKFTDVLDVDEARVEDRYCTIDNYFNFINSLLNQKNNEYNHTLNFDRMLTIFKYFYNAFELDMCWHDKDSDSHKFKTLFKLIIKNYPNDYQTMFGVLMDTIKISDKLSGDSTDNILIENSINKLDNYCSIILDLIKFKNKTKKS